MAEDVIPRSGGAVLTGRMFSHADANSEIFIYSGTRWNNGAYIELYGGNSPYHSSSETEGSRKGKITLGATSESVGNKFMNLFPNGTWAWDGTACQITSDQRLKQQINQIDEKLLDAWEDVTLVQFKYNDAVDQKGDNARLHTGYVVQQIDTACKSHNVDISDYGLYCHEEYPEETEEVEVEQADGTKTKERKVIREASEHYSLRYTEVYAVECMYLRRENSRLKEKLASLEERLEKLEKAENSENQEK